ncbi:hypothetical protein GOBAR_DD31747 [Gossypium barbadense]|nr:hypothetical protein GOBAR_DD31747 [Gossypium barbadense]
MASMRFSVSLPRRCPPQERSPHVGAKPRSGSGKLTLAEPSESDPSAKAAKSLSFSDLGMKVKEREAIAVKQPEGVSQSYGFSITDLVTLLGLESNATLRDTLHFNGIVVPAADIIWLGLAGINNEKKTTKWKQQLTMALGPDNALGYGGIGAIGNA